MLWWAVTAVCFAGTLLNIKKRRVCFILWGVGNVIWFVLDMHTGLYSRAALDTMQLATCVFGYKTWTKE